METLLIVAAWASLAGIFFLTMSPPKLRPRVASAPVERGLAFAVLGLLFGLAYPDWALAVAVGTIASAPVLELAQRLVPGRHGEVIDALQKMMGAAIGVFAAWVLIQII